MSKQETIVEWKRIGGKLVRVETRRKKKAKASKAEAPQGIGFWGVACVCVAAVTLFAAPLVGMRTEAKLHAQELQVNAHEVERLRSQAEATARKNAREQEYGWLADIAECADKYGPGCWDRIAPKNGAKR